MQKLFPSLCLSMMAFASKAQTTSYTLADVATHATSTDCWMVLNTNKVYNFTPFVSMHPGGSTMVPYCGKNGDPGFASVRHTSNAVALEATYLIGNLTTAPAAISVQITPVNTSINIGSTVQFTPTVANSTQGVAWTVVPSTVGTIGASGLFTGVTAGQATVTAASTQDSTKSASAIVTVSSATSGGGGGSGAIALSIAPSAVTLNAGSRVRFQALLSNSSQGVTWTASASIGIIDKNGRLTASMTPGTGTVTATSVQDPTKSASAQVTLTAITCRSEAGTGTGTPTRVDD